MFHHRLRLIAVSALLAGISAAGGCAGNRSLNDADRADLRNQPVIQVLHYVTPPPSVDAPKANVAPQAIDKLQAAPTGNDIQMNLGGYDPTLDLSRRFSGMLARSAGLKNLRLDRETAPLPRAMDAKGFQTRYKNGAVLEVWIDDWGFRHVPADLKTYTPTFNARARLTRMQDGQVLWNAGRCSYAGTGKNFNDRIVLADLKSKGGKRAQAKFRQVMGQVADHCAQQLLRDYSGTN